MASAGALARPGRAQGAMFYFRTKCLGGYLQGRPLRKEMSQLRKTFAHARVAGQVAYRIPISLQRASRGAQGRTCRPDPRHSPGASSEIVGLAGRAGAAGSLRTGHLNVDSRAPASSMLSRVVRSMSLAVEGRAAMLQVAFGHLGRAGAAGSLRTGHLDAQSRCA